MCRTRNSMRVSLTLTNSDCGLATRNVAVIAEVEGGPADFACVAVRRSSGYTRSLSDWLVSTDAFWWSLTVFGGWGDGALRSMLPDSPRNGTRIRSKTDRRTLKRGFRGL